MRYILTYIAPSLGYESQAHNPVIQDVIDAYPNHRIIATFDVAETATGHDRAALIDKFGGAGGRCHRAGVRNIDERAIKAHADLRFRSEYDYALFEYYRSAKVIAFLERAGVPLRGRVLDDGLRRRRDAAVAGRRNRCRRRHRSRRTIPGGGRAART